MLLFSGPSRSVYEWSTSQKDLKKCGDVSSKRQTGRRGYPLRRFWLALSLLCQQCAPALIVDRERTGLNSPVSPNETFRMLFPASLPQTRPVLYALLVDLGQPLHLIFALPKMILTPVDRFHSRRECHDTSPYSKRHLPQR